MRHRALLMIRLCSDEEARIFDLSLAPDNKPLPRGISIAVKRRGRRVFYSVTCIDRPPETLLSTLDDIIRALILVEKVACERS